MAKTELVTETTDLEVIIAPIIYARLSVFVLSN